MAHGVALKVPNGWGLYDMLGNVAEWCNDLQDFRGYGAAPLVDPIWLAEPGRELAASQDYPYRVSRGGTYLSPACSSKASWRLGFPDGTFGTNLGLRLARTIRRAGREASDNP